jgi:UDP-glucose 4-epimerase
MIKNILIMGGSGQLGSELINCLNNLYSSKIKIFAFDKNFIKNNYANNIKFIKGDCSNLNDLNKLPRKIDIIFFLIGFNGGPNSKNINYIKDYFNYNSNTLFIFLNKIKNYKIKKIIFTSTEHVYGDNSVNFNSTTKQESYPKNYYGASKILSEKILYSFYKNQLNASVDIFRIPRVINYSGTDLISKMIHDAIYKNKIILTSPSTTFNFIFINDLLKAFVNSMKQQKKKFRILNIFNNSRPLSLKIIAVKIFRKLRIKKKIRIYDNGTLANHNPINLKISNKYSKKELKWNPLFSTDKIINELIIHNVFKKNIR